MKKSLFFIILTVICALSLIACAGIQEEDELYNVSRAEEASNDAAVIPLGNTTSLEPEPEPDIFLGDVNGDGFITNADVLMIYRYIYDPELYPIPSICQHTYGDWTVEIPTTCDIDGKMTRTCNKCSNIEETTVKGCHVYEEIITPPTLADEGYTENTCKRCGDSFKNNFVPAIGFSSFAYSVNEDGETCTITGMGAVTETSFEIPSELDGYKVTAIGNKAFHGYNSIKNVILPEGVISIGYEAFEDCDKLVNITIPNSVISIGEWAFAYCSSLESITIPDGVESIKYATFNNCQSLKSITFSDSITSIESCAFYYCTALTDVYYKGTQEQWANIQVSSENYRITIATVHYIFEPEIDITEFDYDVNSDGETCTVTGIGSVTETEITIPSVIDGYKVTAIGNNAFFGCNSLESVTIGDGVTTIGESAFEGCTSLVSVNIPDSVTLIEYSAFFECCLLESIKIPQNVTTIGDWAFSYCSSLKSVTIPDGVTSIGEGILSECVSLESVIIGDGITIISNDAFFYCTSLTNISMSDKVTTIGESAFCSCESLASITIPDSVTSIKLGAFRYCDNLTDVYYTGTQEQWEQIQIGYFNDTLTFSTIHYNHTVE